MEGCEADALRLVEVAKKYSMTGIGVKQNGPAGKRFISTWITWEVNTLN